VAGQVSEHTEAEVNVDTTLATADQVMSVCLSRTHVECTNV